MRKTRENKNRHTTRHSGDSRRDPLRDITVKHLGIVKHYKIHVQRDNKKEREKKKRLGFVSQTQQHKGKKSKKNKGDVLRLVVTALDVSHFEISLLNLGAL